MRCISIFITNFYCCDDPLNQNSYLMQIGGPLICEQNFRFLCKDQIVQYIDLNYLKFHYVTGQNAVLSWDNNVFKNTDG